MSAFAAMTRDEVIEKYLAMVTKYNLKDGELWLGGGSAMIMYGLRDTTMDLDAGAHKKVFEAMAKKAKAEILVFNKSDGFLHDDTRLFALTDYYTDVHLEPDTEMNDINEIDGVWCYTPEKLMWQKQLLAKVLKREKDFKDIERLREYMQSNK